LELGPAAAGERWGCVAWPEVEGAARSALIQLEADIKGRLPSVRASLGTASGGAVRVFSYCAFSFPSNDEAIVVGVTVAAVDEGFLLTADVCGEDSGRILLQEPPQHLDTEEGSRELAEVAGNLAARLTRRVDEIVSVLCAEGDS
jgi:hypothetical protein